MKKCPKCGSQNKDLAAKCWHCEMPFPEEEMHRITKRPDCGGGVSVRAAPCPHCGAPVREYEPLKAEVVSAPKQEQHPLRQRSVYIFLAIVLGLLGIHNFYAGRKGWAIAQLLLFGVPLIMCLILEDFLLWIWFVSGLIWFCLGIWVLVNICTITTDRDGNQM